MSPLGNNGGIRKNGNASGHFYGTWLFPGMDIVTPGWKGTFAGEVRGMMVVRNFNMGGTFDGGMMYDTDYIITITCIDRSTALDPF